MPPCSYYDGRINVITVPIKQFRTAFRNADLALGRYRSQDEQRAKWIAVYNVTPVDNTRGFAHWEYCEFHNQEDYIMFLIRWG